jgi:hypothetical protein
MDPDTSSQYTHEENLVYLSDTSECYGGDFRKLATEIRSEINGDLLSLEDHLEGPDSFHRDDFLLHNSIWIIHYSRLLHKNTHHQLHSYLSTNLIPDATKIFVCIDDDCSQISLCDRFDLDDTSSKYEIKNELDDEYEDRIITAVKLDKLKYQAAGYLNTANPVCGPSGVEAIEEWKQAVDARLDS